MNEQIYEAEVCLPFYDAITDDVLEIKFDNGIQINGEMYKLQGKTIKVKNKRNYAYYEYESEGFNWKSSWLKNIRPLIPKRWRAEFAKPYYAINTFGEVNCMTECHSKTDDYRYASHNYYRTREEAQKALDLQTIENELVALIAELNAGRKLDWIRNTSQVKYYLRYDFDYKKIRNIRCGTLKDVDNKFCCLDEDLREKATERIGKDRLEMYLRER